MLKPFVSAAVLLAVASTVKAMATFDDDDEIWDLSCRLTAPYSGSLWACFSTQSDLHKRPGHSSNAGGVITTDGLRFAAVAASTDYSNKPPVFTTDQQYITFIPAPAPANPGCSIVTIAACKGDTGKTTCEQDPGNRSTQQWCPGSPDIPLL